MTIARLNLALVVFVSAICCAQSHARIADSPKLAQLPDQFSGFTEDDVLAKIFDGYDATTKSVSSIPDSENKPTKVTILEAKPWRTVGNLYLVVLTSLGDPQMCGNCAMYSPLAVLKADGTSLSLIARQDLPRHSSIDESVEVSGVFGSLSYGGHESIAFDLAPYKLTNQELLVGVRIEHMWLAAPFWQTRLFLFRVEDTRLRKVFEAPVIDRDYPNAHKNGPQIVLKTTSTLSTTTNSGQYYELLVKKKMIKCRENDDGDCDPNSGSVQQVKTTTEVWRFDGEKFNLVPRARGDSQAMP